MRVRKMYWAIGLVVMLIVIIVGLFLRAGGKFIALEYRDFPRDQLEKLITDKPPEAELTLSGPSEVEVSSPWTWWAMKLLPGTFLADVKINGYKASLVVDTGAALTYISPEIAVAAKVTLTSSARLVGWHGEQDVPAYIGWVQELTLDNLRVRNLPITVGGNQPVMKLLGLPVWNLDGLLGMESLRRLAVTLDYERGIVVLRREPAPAQGDSAPLQLVSLKPAQGLESLEQTRPIVEGFINFRGPYPCFIDTGTSAPVSVPPEVWHALGLEGQKQAQLTIKLGELQLQGVPAIPAKVGQILIGSNIFQAQGFKRLTLDFLAGKLYAER